MGQEEREMKECPFCKEEIQAAAIKCKHCGSMLDVLLESQPVHSQQNTYRRMAKDHSGTNWGLAIVAAIAVAALAVTNPSDADFVEYVKDENVTKNKTANPLLGPAIELFLPMMTKRKDYFLFSVYKFDTSLINMTRGSSLPNAKFLGVLGNFIPLSGYDFKNKGQNISSQAAAPVMQQNTEIAVSAGASAADTHCSSDEQVVFSCNTGKKIVSVCASQPLTPSNGSIQYRFGPKGAPELTFPETQVHFNSFAKAGMLTFSGGGGAYLRLANGKYRYVVYTAILRSSPQGGHYEEEGVVVEKDGEVIANLKCQSPALSELGPDFSEKAGLPEDEEGFDLP